MLFKRRTMETTVPSWSLQNRREHPKITNSDINLMTYLLVEQMEERQLSIRVAMISRLFEPLLKPPWRGVAVYSRLGTTKLQRRRPNAFAGRSHIPPWALLHQRHRRYISTQHPACPA